MVENNENDTAQIRARLDPDDTLKFIKEDLLDEKYRDRKLKIKKQTSNNAFAKLMSFMRYIEYTGDIAFLRKVLIRW